MREKSIPAKIKNVILVSALEVSGWLAGGVTAGSVMIVQLVMPRVSLWAQRPVNENGFPSGSYSNQGSFFPSSSLVVHSKWPSAEIRQRLNLNGSR
jgi:hypothetical protein